MNYQHIDALLRWSGNVMSAEFNGRTLITQGHFCCEWDGFKGETEAFAKLGQSWETFAKRGAQPSEVGNIFPFDNLFYRAVGPAFVNEAYLRCFQGDGETFTATSKDKEILVHSSDGRFLGAIMPVRHEPIGDPVKNPTDAQVFEHFSTEENGFYLCCDVALRQHVAELEIELEQKQDLAYSLEGQIDHLERNIKAGREKLKRLAEKAVLA